MSGRPNMNRTRNGTMPPPLWNNPSNNSNFGQDDRNGTQSGPSLFDETPDATFYLLATLVIPSLLCFLFLFYNFFRLPHLIKKSTNFFIISLLIINFIHLLLDLPFRLYFLSQNQVLIKYPFFCLLWTCYDNILTTTDLFIMAFSSIERRLSVFHHLFLRRYKRFIYTLPIVVCFAVPTIWYTVLIFGYPCRQPFGYYSFQCGTLCYLTASTVFVNFENVVFFMFPLFVMVIGNSTLIISVLMQKSSMKRQHRLGLWRSNFRMMSQLMFMAILYMSIYVPSCLLLIFGSYVPQSRFQPAASSIRTRYFTHLKYLVIFGCPFMILAGQKEMHGVIQKIFSWRRPLWRTRWKTQTIRMTVVQTAINGNTRA